MTRLILTTANVGSVFENIEEGLETWLDTFLTAVQDNSPQFVAVHFQETGGKNYQNCTNEIYVFFNELRRRFEEQNFLQVEGFVDSLSEIEDQFTALASVYFIHKDLKAIDVQIWDFKDETFFPVTTDHPLHIGEELDKTNRKQKEKFPQDYFPNFKWSRKGFLRTRWRINGVCLDLVNCHLFHDSCNLIAGSSFPSTFAQNRLKTLNYTLDKLLKDDEDSFMFIFGDFNFRLNTYEIFESLRRKLSSDQLNFSNNDKRLPPAPNDSELIIESKYFSCPDQEQRFKKDFDWLRRYDFEAQQFSRLTEWILEFHPSYPFDETLPDKFMKTRCPAWCDRVLFTHRTKLLFESQPPPVYQLIGSNICTGDHKPIYFAFTIRDDEPLRNINSKKAEDLPVDVIEENLDAGKNCCQEVGDKENSKCSSVDSIKSNNRQKCKCLVSFFRKSLISKGKSKRRHGHSHSHKNCDHENTSVLLNSDCDLESKPANAHVNPSPTRASTTKLQSSSSFSGNRASPCQEIRDLNSNSCYHFLKKYSKWKSREEETNNDFRATADDKSNSSSSVNNIKLGNVRPLTTSAVEVDSQDLFLPPILIESDIVKSKTLDNVDEIPESPTLSFDRLSLKHSPSGSIIQVQEEVQCQPLNPTTDDVKVVKKLGKRTTLLRFSRKKKAKKAKKAKKKNSNPSQENEPTSTVLCNKCVIL